MGKAHLKQGNPHTQHTHFLPSQCTTTTTPTDELFAWGKEQLFLFLKGISVSEAERAELVRNLDKGTRTEQRERMDPSGSVRIGQDKDGRKERKYYRRGEIFYGRLG
jgi:hypothetical protein